MIDPTNHEQTELLRNIWQQMVAMDRNLSSRIDQTNVRLDRTNVRLDQTNVRLDKLIARMQENFTRVQHNFESLETARSDRGRRLEELDTRLVRLEEHVGLRTPE